jgi:hypothetical protein
MPDAVMPRTPQSNHKEARGVNHDLLPAKLAPDIFAFHAAPNGIQQSKDNVYRRIC